MRRVGVAFLMGLLVLATGCGGQTTKVEPPPPAVQEPPAPPPAQSPAPAAPQPAPPPVTVDVCDQKLPLAERQLALRDLLLKGGQPGPCVRVYADKDQSTTLAVGTLEKGGFLSAFAWQPPAGGAKAAVIPPPAGGWEVADNLGLLGPVSFTDGRLSLFLQELSSGTGGYKRLVHVSEATDGTLATTAVTDVYEKAWFQFIKPDLIFLNFRGNPGPQAWECNACLTANNQFLWRWNGKELVKVGERLWSEPYLTVNLLLGAIKNGDTKAAAGYVTDPALVAKAGKLIGTDVLSWQARQWTEDYGKIQDAERTAWDLLPAGVRTAVTQSKYDIPLTKASQQVIFHLTRTDKGWLVSGIN